MTASIVGSRVGYALSTVKDYWLLLKPRIMYLVVFTSTTGMIVAPGSMHPLIGLVATICVALGAGASGALNMWYDSDIDAMMSRTKLRPVPAGKISRINALECGIALSILSVLIMAIAVNYVSAILLAGSIFFYVVIYTIILKRRTPQNIVIGGVAGALPPVIGWASVTGSVELESLLLFLIIFLWTPPHFWALSLLHRDDYKLAGIPMLSVYDLEATKKHMLIYSVALCAASILPGFYMQDRALYWIIATSLGFAFIYHAVTVYREPGEPSHAPCMGMFSFSIYYLFLIFSAITLCY